ncbi:MAG: serine/threonine protein kinase [Oscillospiraceae bacterium]|nr:serine/threonine protein kinase [Oscillospiraceae bacterium]
MNNICYSCFNDLPDTFGPCHYCGYNAAVDRGKYPQALPAGTILAGRYTVGRVLGQGGFGITYAARDRVTKTRVAIKEYFPDGAVSRQAGALGVIVSNGARRADYEYGLDGFINEAKVLAALKRVPNIVDIYTCFRENGTAYFAMEYVEGTSLKERLRACGGKLPWQEAVGILLPVMEALASVHREGLIHRDVAPDNIYITDEGNIKLLDFGAARYSLGNQTQTLDVILKRGYAPIEQYASRVRQGPYTDVYSMAACLYAAVTGIIPPESIERMYADKLVNISSFGINIPWELECAIYKGLKVQAAERYQSMEEFGAAVRAAMEEKAVDDPIEGPGTHAIIGRKAKELTSWLKAVPIGLRVGICALVPVLGLTVALWLTVPGIDIGGDDIQIIYDEPQNDETHQFEAQTNEVRPVEENSGVKLTDLMKNGPGSLMRAEPETEEEPETEDELSDENSEEYD